jgi:hypothetical protein
LKKRKSNFDIIGEPEKWEDKDRFSEAAILNIKRYNKKGISIRSGKKSPYKRYNLGVWIDEDLDLPSWLNWFIKTVKKLYFKLFSKKISTIDEEVEFYKTKAEKLSKELAETQRRLEESKKKEEERKEILELAQKSIEHLEKYKIIFKNFKELIDNIYKNKLRNEEKIKETIFQNNWLLGLECHVEAKNKSIDTQTQIDLHIKTRFNQDRIFEIKSPNLKPFVRKQRDPKKRLVISSELADGLSELIVYMRKTDIYSSLRTEGVYGIQKASGYILIGYNLDKTELEILKELNFHLYPHIQILTYNDLIQNIDEELGIVDYIKNKAQK